MRVRAKQIHIAPLGYEQERIYIPAIENDADTVFLLEHTNDEKNSGSGVSKAQECKGVVRRKLMEEDIDIFIHECDLFNINSVALAISELVYEHADAEVYVNVTTGTKLSAIGAMIACTATEAVPYYVEAEEYIGETITTGVKDTREVPVYPLTLPHKQYVDVLSHIDSEDKVNKGDIVSFAQDFPLLSSYNRDEEKNMYNPVTEEIVDPLLEQGYLKEVPMGGEKLYELTEDAEEALEILSYMIE